MQTKVDEIAAGIYRLSTFLPQVAPPAGFQFNQFLIDADQPLLFHSGQRALFPLVSAAVAKVMPVDRVRWIGFSHVEADECGSMNEWLAAAPQAQVTHGVLACNVSLNDMANRPPRPLADGEVLDLGGKRVRFIATPHVPHAWEAGLMFEETTGTLLCSDLFTRSADGPALTDQDIVGPAIASETVAQFSALTPLMAPTLRKLADLAPRTLALMHGASYNGDGRQPLLQLADYYAERLAKAVAH
jgi:flavorubredoxin